MNKNLLGAQVAIIALGWMMVIAFGMGPGFDSDTLWVIALFLGMTACLALDRWLPARPPGNERTRPGPPSWAEKLVESIPGKIVLVLLGLALIAGTGGLVGTMVCVPVKGLVETIAGLPEILGAATVGAAMSVIGFGLLALLLSLLGPILWVAFEEWIGYIAPVIGGIVGAVLESGILTGGIAIVGSSILVGGLASVIFEASTSKKSVSVKAVGESLTAGLGFGLINGLILAVLFKVLRG